MYFAFHLQLLEVAGWPLCVLKMINGGLGSHGQRGQSWALNSGGGPSPGASAQPNCRGCPQHIKGRVALPDAQPPGFRTRGRSGLHGIPSPPLPLHMGTDDKKVETAGWGEAEGQEGTTHWAAHRELGEKNPAWVAKRASIVQDGFPASL